MHQNDGADRILMLPPTRARKTQNFSLLTDPPFHANGAVSQAVHFGVITVYMTEAGSIRDPWICSYPS